MIKKWLNRILFAVILSYGFFTISYYLCQEIIINEGTTKFTFEISAEEEEEVTISYNKLATQDGAETYEHELPSNYQPYSINVPFPTNKILKRIFLTTRSETSLFYLKRISVSSMDKSIQWDGTKLIETLKLGNQNGTFNTEFTEEKRGVPIHLNKQFPILLIRENLFKELYLELHFKLYQKLQNYLAIASVILFILLLLVFSRSRRKFGNPSFAINGCALFLLIIFIPFFSQKEHETTENRTLASFPDLSRNIWRFPSAYNAYYNDHFPFRNELAKLDNIIKIKLFGISPNPNFVRIGKEDWLFCSMDEVKNAYQNTQNYTDKELKKIQKGLEEKALFLEKKNIAFYLMIPPLKHSIYPEYLPKSLVKKDALNRRQQLLNYLKVHSTINIIDPFDVLIQLKDSARVYYKNDTHWNRLGAFKAYQLMIEIMAKKHPQLKPLRLSQYKVSRDFDYNGDLTALLNLKNVYYREPYVLVPNFERKASEALTGPLIGTEKTYVYYEGDTTNSLRLLMYRDSFAEYLRDYLAENFSYSAFSWDRTMNPDRIEKVKPDIIVYELMERYIEDLLIEEK